MSVTRIGSTQQFADNWDAVFGKKRTKGKKKAALKKSTKKKAVAKKKAKAQVTQKSLF